MSLRDLLVTSETKKDYIEYKEKEKEIKRIKQIQKEKLNQITDPDLKIRKATQDKDVLKEHYKILRQIMKNFDYVKNPLLKEFELETPKEIRANAIKSLCDAIKSGISNLKKGHIKFFNMKYKTKKESNDIIELSKSCISLKNGVVKILPTFFKEECYLKISSKNKKKHKDLIIDNNADITKKNGNYYLNILKKTEVKESIPIQRVCGVDPGVRTLATVYSTNQEQDVIITEYIHQKEALAKYTQKLKLLKKNKKYYRKKQYNKQELKKKHLIDSIHWDLINHLLKENDVIYFGDIKSHDIVNGNKNKTLNQSMNDLKFYVLKQRLKYKAFINQKKVIFVNEAYTTKTCSRCGTLNNHVGSKETFHCSCCHLTTGRDINASKNIFMKGLLC
jgi:putative transposase